MRKSISLGFSNFMGAWRVSYAVSPRVTEVDLVVVDSACLYDDDGTLLVGPSLRLAMLSSRNLNALVREDYRGPGPRFLWRN